MDPTSNGVYRRVQTASVPRAALLGTKTPPSGARFHAKHLPCTRLRQCTPQTAPILLYHERNGTPISQCLLSRKDMGNRRPSHLYVCYAEWLQRAPTSLEVRSASASYVFECALIISHARRMRSCVGVYACACACACARTIFGEGGAAEKKRHAVDARHSNDVYQDVRSCVLCCKIYLLKT